MDICNPPTPLDDIDIFLRSAVERYLAEGGARFRYWNEVDLAFIVVHTIATHNGFCGRIYQDQPQGFPHDIVYTFCTAPRDSRAFVTLDRCSGESLRVKGYWWYPGFLDNRDRSLSYEARFDFNELKRPLWLVLGPLLLERTPGVDVEGNYGEEELGVLRRFWRVVEVNVCRPLGKAVVASHPFIRTINAEYV